MGVHGPRLTTAALAATVVVAAVAAAAEPPPVLSRGRVCHTLFFGGELWDPFAQECMVDERHSRNVVSAYACSVRYRTLRPAPFSARILYEGRVQRSYKTTVEGRGTKAIGLAFAALPESGPGAALPGGRYVCEFSLGRSRLRVPFRAPGAPKKFLAPLACRTAATYERACLDYAGRSSTLPATHSVTCSAIFARLQRHRVEIDFWRGRTLVYAAKDVLRYPITSEWAHTSAAPGEPLPVGDYRCDFRVDGHLVGTKTFTVLP